MPGYPCCCLEVVAPPSPTGSGCPECCVDANIPLNLSVDLTPFNIDFNPVQDTPFYYADWPIITGWCPCAEVYVEVTNSGDIGNEDCEAQWDDQDAKNTECNNGLDFTAVLTTGEVDASGCVQWDFFESGICTFQADPSALGQGIGGESQPVNEFDFDDGGTCFCMDMEIKEDKDKRPATQQIIVKCTAVLIPDFKPTQIGKCLLRLNVIVGSWRTNIDDDDGHGMCNPAGDFTYPCCGNIIDCYYTGVFPTGSMCDQLLNGFTLNRDTDDLPPNLGGAACTGSLNPQGYETPATLTIQTT